MKGQVKRSSLENVYFLEYQNAIPIYEKNEQKPSLQFVQLYQNYNFCNKHFI